MACSRARALLVGLCAWLTSTSAVAGVLEDRAVIVLCYERYDGAEQSSCALKQPLFTLFRREGALLVDPRQAERLKQKLAPEALRDPSGLSGVNLLDAELAVVVEVRVTTLDHAVGRMKAREVSATIDFIDVSRGLNVHSWSGRGRLPAADAGFAAQRVAADLWQNGQADIAAGLIAALTAPVGADLWVYDLPDLDHAHRVGAFLDDRKLVTKQRLAHFGGGLAKLRIELAAGRSLFDLLFVVEREPTLLLAAQGVNGQMAQLAYRPQEKAKVPVGVDVEKAALGWSDDDLRGLVVAEVTAARYLTPGDVGSPLRLRVSVTPQKGGAEVRLAVVDQGRTLAQARKDGKRSDVPTLVQQGFRDVLAQIEARARRDPRSLKSLALAATAPEALTVNVAIPEAARFGRGANVSVAWLASSPALAVEVTPAPEGLRGRARLLVGTAAFGEEAQGERGQLDAPVAIDVEALSALTRPTPAVLEVELSGRLGERLVRRTTALPVTLYPAGTAPLDGPAPLAALVDPKAPWAADIVRTSAADPGETPTPWLARSAAVWNHLGSLGLDVVAPSDGEGPLWWSARSPHLALAGKKLTSTEVAVAAATGFASAGVPTRLIATDAALLVAVDSGLPPGAWPLLAREAGRALVVDERLFVPLDATLLGKDFYAAARAGGDRLAAAGRPVVVDVTAAWAAHAPFAQAAVPVTLPPPRRFRVLVLDHQLHVLPSAKLPSARPAGAEGSRPAAQSALQAALTAGLGRLPSLQVTSTQDLERILDAAALAQVAGCEEERCLPDVAKLVDARLLAFGRTASAGEHLVTELVLFDTTAREVVGRVTLRARDLAHTAAVLEEQGEALVGAFLDGEGIPRFGGSAAAAFAAHRMVLATAAPRPGLDRVRFYAVAGELEAARSSLSKVTNRKERALAEANLALLSGEDDDALLRLEKALAAAGGPGDERAATNGLLASALASDRRRAQWFFAALPAATRVRIEAPPRADDGPEISLLREAWARAEGRPSEMRDGPRDRDRLRYALRW